MARRQHPLWMQGVQQAQHGNIIERIKNAAGTEQAGDIGQRTCKRRRQLTLRILDVRMVAKPPEGRQHDGIVTAAHSRDRYAVPRFMKYNTRKPDQQQQKPKDAHIRQGAASHDIQYEHRR